ncbi:hypothetical protein ABCR94_01445 [Streptomyces sp. 21So2-11]|uniref:hypothetical protein n=1 Tax=Streptomyces sp. 21So2-11 TaxID=3144408 RepID=UPI0032193F1B
MALWSVAFFTQAAILENAQLLSGAVWPTCHTGHRHPMELSQEGEHDWPAWSCPKNPFYRRPVGQHPGP